MEACDQTLTDVEMSLDAITMAKIEREAERTNMSVRSYLAKVIEKRMASIG